MKKFKVLAIIMAALVLAGMISACSGGKSSKKEKESTDPVDQIAGEWVEIDEDGEEGDTYVFARNGKGTVSSDGISGDITWSVENDVLTMTLSICGISETSNFNYKISGNKMTLTEIPDEDDEVEEVTALTLKKVKGPAD